MKPLKDLTFTDDFMFTHILTTRKEICKGLLERLLHIKITDIEYPEREKMFKAGYNSRGIRVDVFVKDKGKDRIFDIELQTGHFANLELRSRYYQSIMDEGFLSKGTDFKELKEIYIIFICTEDPFKKGLPVYTVEQKIKENGIEYDDRSHKIFYNVSAFESETDAEIKGFLQFLKTGKAQTNFTREIMQAIDYTKKMSADEYIHYKMLQVREFDVREEGRQEGEHNKAVETALALLGLAVNTHEQIATVTGLSLSEVQQLAEQLKTNASRHA